jgi:3-oxoacyl-[acyl-carrier protein] reductase
MVDAKRLEGKAALVMGGSRGIGAAIVRRLAREGAAVAFTYSASPGRAEQVVREVAEAGGTALAIQADSGDAQAVRAAVEEAARALGGLHVLVNNAGILMRATLDAFSLDDFDRIVAVNVRGTFVAAQAAARWMGEGGRIITIGSNAAVRVAFPGGGVYAMTKSAVAGLVRGLAIDLAPRGITVNNVQPGPTDTEMNGEPGIAEMVRPLIPLRRMGTSDEVAGLVAYLASPESAFMTGASLTIDGGYSA